MTPRQFWQSTAPEAVAAVAKGAGTTPDNFKQIAMYGGYCSARLARRLAEASDGLMTLEDILFRDERDRESAA